MAETPTKRHRNDAEEFQNETPKRHRNSYNNEQQENSKDLLDFFTNLPSDPFLDFTHQPEPDPDDKSAFVDVDDDEKERVIRYLFEASDDELGLPSMVDGAGNGDDNGGGSAGNFAGGVASYGGYSFGLYDGLWDLEDEAANYCTLLQSGLFTQ